MTRRYIQALIIIAFLSSRPLCALDALSLESLEISPGLGYYLFDGERDFNDTAYGRIGFGLYLSPAIAFELGYSSLQSEHKYIKEIDDIDVQLFHFDAYYYFRSDKRIQPYISTGINSYSEELSGNKSDETLLNLAGGVKYIMTPNWSIRSDLRAFFSDDENRIDSAISFALNYRFGRGLTQQFDLDSDGVTDDKDRCLATSSGINVDDIGCPLDSDKDAISDHKDHCKNTPESVAVDPNGCPFDSDRDNVADYLDQCPNTPEHLKTDATGCPVDDDLDGILNNKDQCPDTKPGAKVDKRGCYLPLVKKVSLSLSISFDNNSSQTKPEHHKELEQVAEYMNKYPQAIVTIEGHSDSIGDAAYNKSISQKRADNIARMLVKDFNIEAFRVKSVGYGEEYPITSNETRAGRQKNRRVVAIVSASN